MSNGLTIGNLNIKVPVIQGGMGVGVSLSRLAGNVAKCGGIGVISTAQIGFREESFSTSPIETNLQAIKTEIAKAREIAGDGVIAVNIMFATQRYEDYVKAAVEAGVDMIISGAGLPMDLPDLVKGSDVKIVPIVSSSKAFDVIYRYWVKKYNRKPDMVIIEGPKAGGHLGFTREEIVEYVDTETKNYDLVIEDIVKHVREASDTYIPVAVAGGIWDRKDYDHAISLGADAVQIATRFVTTVECDASEAYKMAYIAAKKDDITIVKSPVGMPGRAIHNKFIDRVNAGERFMTKCRKCVKTCKPDTIPFCITNALINAVEGSIDEGLIFCGSNAYRADRIEKVSDIMEEFI